MVRASVIKHQKALRSVVCTSWYSIILAYCCVIYFMRQRATREKHPEHQPGMKHLSRANVNGAFASDPRYHRDGAKGLGDMGM